MHSASKPALCAFGAILVALVAGLGCDDDHDHGTGTGGHSSPHPSCNAIIAQCHPLDVGEGPIHDCHDVAHDAPDDAACAARKEECFRICVAPSDAGVTDARDQ